MKLAPTWITDGTIDFEYKKYQLLAYLQSVKKEFEATRYFPYFYDVKEHCAQVGALKHAQRQLSEFFPKKLLGIDASKLKLRYEPLYREQTQLSEVKAILDYAEQQLSETVSEGERQTRKIAEQLRVRAVGLLPLHKQEGYIFLHTAAPKPTYIYQYALSLYSSTSERGLNTILIDEVQVSLSYTFEKIKRELIASRKELPNPATFLVVSSSDYPLEETLLPLAKKCVAKAITNS